MHGETLLDFDHKKVYIFLISLQQIDRVLAFHDQNFARTVGEEFSELCILNGDVIEFKGTIEDADEGRK